MVISFQLPARGSPDSFEETAPTSALEAMSPALDDLSLRFAMHAGQTNGTCLDVGCGTGLATAAALARGGHVVAVDPDAAACRELLARVPVEQYARLSVRTSSLPTLDFMAPRFSAVHAARVLHNLSGLDVRASAAKFFRWLYPEGRLYLSALTPFGSFWKRFQPEYTRRVRLGSEWPGYLADVARFHSTGARKICHLLDENVLRRELCGAGFVIEHLSRYSLPWEPTQICYGIVARCAP
jgi:ubiquinone/menaquinone biosynthesis C-methylase UbiE